MTSTTTTATTTSTTSTLEAKVAPGPPFELTNAEDLKLVDTLNDEGKKVFLAAVRDIIELNGTGDIPGIQASYISVNEYVQDFSGTKHSAEVKKSLFMAWNWHALGRGVGGLCGAGVRWALRNYFTGDREITRHLVAPKGSKTVIDEYEAASKANHDLINFFITNAISVAALAGAMVNRIVHHWDAKHTGAQKAFISAMGMADSLPEDQFRPVFYLAVHPIPLLDTETIRKATAAGTKPEVAEVVKLRCIGPPAGFGAVNACAAAVHAFIAEPYMQESHWIPREVPDFVHGELVDNDVARQFAKVRESNRIITARRANVAAVKASVIEVYTQNQKLIANAGAYHQFATKYGYTSKAPFDHKALETAMIILTAYIFAKVKGSLAQSAALRKFRDQHAREVNKRVTAFSNLDEDEDAYSVIGI